MSSNEKNIPKRRFKEFQKGEAWEQLKLEDICLIITKQTGFDYSSTIKPSLITEPKSDTLSFIQNKDFEGEKINLDTDFYIPCEVANRFPKITLDMPSLLISISGKIGNVGFYNLSQKAFIGGAVGICKLMDGNLGAIIVYALQSDSGQNYFRSFTKVSSHANITVEDIRNIEIKLPIDINESNKIVSHLHNLDNLITLNQRKLDKLKVLKKAYLAQMFPSVGESKPRLRFSGFNDDWEKRKIGDLFKVTRGNVLAATETVDEKTNEMPYPVYSSQTKNNGLMGYYKDFLFDTAITWTTDGANAGTVNYREGRFYSTNVNGVLISNEGFANKAVAEVLNQVAYKYVSKVGNPKLMNNVMSDITINIPINIAEQNKISEYFTSLDNLITLHQRKLEKLQNIKKAYLNEMFV